MIITCCIVTKSNSVFFKRSLANIYYIISSLCMLILWNKMYQDFCCYSDLKDITWRRKKRVIILSTATLELEFCNGRESFLVIEIHVGNSDLDSHLFWLIKKSYFELLRERENRIGAMIVVTFLINIFFLNIQPSFSKTRKEYFNIKIRLLFRET